MLIDLQLHSTNSDGYLTPTDLALFCKKRGVKAASLTDHNTVSGQEEFRRACKQHKIKVIPGMEMYVKMKNYRLNLLWYNFDIEDPEIHELLRESQNRRRVNVRHALERLVRRQYVADVNVILDRHNHYIPINHIIDSFYELNKQRIQRELGKKNIIEREIISYYFRNPDKTMMRESYTDIKRILKIRKKVGGQLVLAHPCKFRWIKEQTVELLKKVGLDGLEVLTPHHSWDAISYLQAITGQHKLIMTGGSDFHRFEEAKWYRIKSSWDYFAVDSKLLPGVQEIIG
ncbi:MAG: PHP domain-containing protein [bacterium]|nr:PHP domain-containing protein [bacterium]